MDVYGTEEQDLSGLGTWTTLVDCLLVGWSPERESESELTTNNSDFFKMKDAC